MWQQVAALALVALAAAWLARRWLKRRATGNCCGEPECPAAKRTLEALHRRDQVG
jgi:hypothetical protein